MKEQPLSNNELQLFSRRNILIKAGIVLPFFGLTWRLWNLQVTEREKYVELSKGNRIRLRADPAPRGIIVDRNKVTLVTNIPLYNLALIREDCPDIEGTLRKVSLTLKISLKSLTRSLENKKHLAKFHPIQLYEDLSWYQLSLVKSYQEEFPGILVEITSRRYYPLGASASHLLGYMGQITEDQMKALPRKKLKSAQMVGQDGLEYVLNEVLVGTDGGHQVEVDSVGRVIKTSNPVDPIPGRDPQLTIDHRLQQWIEKELKDITGSCIVMNPMNGEILAMVSMPNFDPNNFSMGIDTQKWKQLRTDPDTPLTNRCIQGAYSPGSTFKMMIAIAALELGLIDETTVHKCNGFHRYKGATQHCWKRSGHGDVNIIEALERSCNVFFYKLAIEIGVDRIHDFAKKLGLGELTEINLLDEKRGVIPNKAWKKKYRGESWYPAETMSVGIGQGYVNVTPLQLIHYANAIANGGKLLRPRVIQSVHSIPQNDPKLSPFPEISEAVHFEGDPIFSRDIEMSPKTLDIVREGMRRNVNGEKGSGRAAKSEIVQVAGKTGTTQVVSNKTKAELEKKYGEVAKKYEDHAWFVGYAPFEKPAISVVLIIEHGIKSTVAAKQVRKIIDYYFSEISPELVPVPPIQEEESTDTSTDTNSIPNPDVSTDKNYV